MNWRDISEGIKAAQQNHDVIMAPTEYVYFDYLQGPRHAEPLAIGWGFNPTERVYAYDPTPAGLTPEQQKHIIGVEAPLWTEHMDTHRKVDCLDARGGQGFDEFPRGAASGAPGVARYDANRLSGPDADRHAR